MISESEAVAMFEEKVIPYVNQNTGRWIRSPRDRAFSSSTQKFQISIKDDEAIRFEFDSGKTSLNFEYWRFIESIVFIYSNENPVVLGKSITANSLQNHLTKYAKDNGKNKAELWCAPHIADLLVLSDITEFTSIYDKKRKYRA